MEKAAIAQCIKEAGNWSRIKPSHRFDRPDFSREDVLRDMDYAAPKLKALLDTIQELDAADRQRDGRVYKHFIYSDIKSAYGAKLIASGLAAMGMNHAYRVARGARGMSFQLDEKQLSKGDGNTFAVLTSVSFFEKNVGVHFRKELLRTYNSRPDNIYGEKIRIIILDSGFREGVDLFDVKYAHLFEPIATVADEKQAVGRITRYCGQKGLMFHPLEGWPVQVYRYETVLTKAVRKMLYAQLPMLEPSETFFDLFMKFSNIDPKKINFANELAQVSIAAAVDAKLTEQIHAFQMQRGGASPTSAARPFMEFQKRINEIYKEYTWPPIQIENGCLDQTLAKPSSGRSGLSAHSGLSGRSGLSNKSAVWSAKSNADWFSSAQRGGAPIILPFTPTQDFIRHYFTPSSLKEKNLSGMLLWHSVGTGKTCTAIATASSSFELQGYTIAYITRHTLKGDVWKNMFNQVCSSILQDQINKGLILPENQAARMRLLGKRWLEPMSYRQFSNMLDGKSQLAAELRKRNGTVDPLRKTLVIIDEAHKMFAPDVAGTEKPDMDVIRRALDTSRRVSGDESVKLLFMTATPYTADPMDLIRLLNLLRPESKKFPEDFDGFSKTYLDDEGRFSPKGKVAYWNEIAGMISYLNRERDIRTFSYPIFHQVKVPISDYEFNDLIIGLKKSRIDYSYHQQNYVLTLRSNNEKIQNKKTGYLEAIKTLKDTYKVKHDDCVDELKVNYIQQTNAEKEKLTKQTKDCLKLKQKCVQDLKKEYADLREARLNQAREELAALAAAAELEGGAPKKAVKAAKKPVKAAKPVDPRKALKTDTEAHKAIRKALKKDLDTLQDDYDFDVIQCKDFKAYNDCVAQAKEDHKRRLDAIPKADVSSCDPILERRDILIAQKEEDMKNAVEKIKMQLEAETKTDKERMERSKEALKIMEKEFGEMVEGDRSQRLRLEKCMKLKPAYERLLKDDPVLMNVEIDTPTTFSKDLQETIEDAGVKKNLFLVLGHGSEIPEQMHERMRMPKDKILVVFPVCSRPNYMNYACQFIHEYVKKENLNFFADPIRHRNKIMSLIQQPMHIYLPNERVPNLSTDLFLVFDNKNDISVAKSGVHRITRFNPIKREHIAKSSTNLGSPKCNPYIGKLQSPNHFNAKIHHEMYKGNLFKPVSVKKPYTEMKSTFYSLQDIMESVGPGIYYYIGCRVSHKYMDSDIYESILAESEKQQEASGREKRLTNLEKILIAEGVLNPEDLSGMSGNTPSSGSASSTSSASSGSKSSGSASSGSASSGSAKKKESVEPEGAKPEGGDALMKDAKALKDSIEDMTTVIITGYFNGQTKDMLQSTFRQSLIRLAAKFADWKERRLLQPNEEDLERAKRKAILKGLKEPKIITQTQIDSIREELEMELEFSAYVLNHLEDSVSSFKSMAGPKKDFKSVVREVVYHCKDINMRRSFTVETLGILPMKLRDTRLKCSSENLLKNILALLNQGISVQMPTDVNAWTPENKKEKFVELCQTVRRMREELIEHD